jgi:DNA-binding transcriptional ArsR family regulator
VTAARRGGAHPLQPRACRDGATAGRGYDILVRVTVGVRTRGNGVAKDPLQPQRCAQLLAALAAPERLKIVRFLADGPHHVTEIADMLGVPAVNVSHHLNVLKQAGLIRGKKDGRFVHYSLRPGVLEAAVEAGIPRDALNLGCCRLELPTTRCPAGGVTE